MVAKRLVAVSEPLREPIAPAFVAAAAIHVMVVLGLGFGVAWPKFQTQSVAVTVLLTPANQAPDDARHIAAQDQAGIAEVAQPEQMAAQFQMQTTMTISRELDGADGELAPDEITPEAVERQLKDLKEALSSLSDQSSVENTRIGAVAARRSLDAEYLSRWRARVEQIGNVLYRGQPLNAEGDVRLMVTVAANGNLQRIRVLESSGDARLDRAAQDTVVLAAPFPPFSEALAKRTADLERAATAGFQNLRLGPRVLRTETAPAAALAVLGSRWGDIAQS